MDIIREIMVEHATPTVVESSIKRECVLPARILHLVISEKVLQVICLVLLLEDFVKKGGHMYVVSERWCLDLDLSL